MRSENNYQFFFDPHTHSKEYKPSDYLSDYKKLIIREREKGLQAIAITDHETITPQWERLQDWVNGIQSFPFQTIFVFPGLELPTYFQKTSKGFSLPDKPTSTSPDHEIRFHLGVIADKYEKIKQISNDLLPFSKPISLKATLGAIYTNNSIGIINHPRIPDDHDWKIRTSALLYIKDLDVQQAIRGIEVFSGRSKDAEEDIASISQTCQWSMIGGSDVHVGKKGWEKNIGKAATSILFSENEVITPNDILFQIHEDGKTEEKYCERRVSAKSVPSQKTNIIEQIFRPIFLQ